MLPLVCMPRWLSVVTTALSLAVLLVCFSLEMTSVRVDQYVGIGGQSGPAGHGTSYFPGRPVMAPPPCTRRLPAIMLAVALVTSPIAASCSSLSSPNPFTGMLAALVPPVHGHQPVQTRRTQVCDIYQSGYIPPLPHHTFSVPDHTFFQEYHTFFRYMLWYITENHDRLYM